MTTADVVANVLATVATAASAVADGRLPATVKLVPVSW